MKLTDQIKNRFTGEIMCGGLSLKVVLEKHQKWLFSEEGGERANLSDADLSAANLRAANLSDADLSAANLRAAPFKIENIHQKIFEAASKPCALYMGSWHHPCGTTHCRAGWVVTLAGEAGKTLEWAYGTPAAAAMIYIASDPKIGKMPNFYCGNEEALADMKARAEAEKAAA